LEPQDSATQLAKSPPLRCKKPRAPELSAYKWIVAAFLSTNQQEVPEVLNLMPELQAYTSTFAGDTIFLVLDAL
jgi:hypothetical protein